METVRVYIRKREKPGDEELREAARILRSGGLVAFPTETVYGLGGNALDPKAAEKIYRAKGRPSDNPLIVHVSVFDEILPLISRMPAKAPILISAFCPGPLTLIFPKSGRVPYETTGGLDTVAIRMPSDPVARTLIRLAGVPVAAPSANLSGRPSPTTADHVWADLNGRIDMVVDGGPVGIGLESTIVDLTGEVPLILRPGAITREMLTQAIGEVGLDAAVKGKPADGVRPKAPGMKYRHYAPKAQLTLVEPREGEDALARMIEGVRTLALEKTKEGRRVGIICTEESKAFYKGFDPGLVRAVGLRQSQESVAHNLFAVLRLFDDLGAEYIYSESFGEDHLGQAIMNRLSKAAGYRIVRV